MRPKLGLPHSTPARIVPYESGRADMLAVRLHSFLIRDSSRSGSCPRPGSASRHFKSAAQDPIPARPPRFEPLLRWTEDQDRSMRTVQVRRRRRRSRTTDSSGGRPRSGPEPRPRRDRDPKKRQLVFEKTMLEQGDEPRSVPILKTQGGGPIRQDRLRYQQRPYI